MNKETLGKLRKEIRKGIPRQWAIIGFKVRGPVEVRVQVPSNRFSIVAKSQTLDEPSADEETKRFASLLKLN